MQLLYSTPASYAERHMAQARYTVTFYRGKTANWEVTLDTESRVHASGRSLAAARTAIRYAAALWAHVDPGDLILEETVQLPPEIQQTVDTVHRQRQQAVTALNAAQRSTSHAVEQLVRQHQLSVRDAAAVLGISFSRVAQILKEKG